MARFSSREHPIGSLALNTAGEIVVAFTLEATLSCGIPLVSLAALAVAGDSSPVRAERPSSG